MGVLSGAELDSYRADGFVRLEGAFARGLAARCADHIWDQLTASPDDPSTWTQPVMRVMDHSADAFFEAAQSPRWVEAIHDVAGPDALPAPLITGTTAIRFPVAGDPGDDGWHIDGSYLGSDGTLWANHRSTNRALLMLALLTDVGEDDAPTRLRAGSHHIVPSLLEPYGDDGVSIFALDLTPAIHDLPLALATGAAGDVYLCHPFLVHAAQRHRGRAPRLVAQPGVGWRPGVDGFPPAAAV